MGLVGKIDEANGHYLVLPGDSGFNHQHIKKYMALASAVRDVESPCLSRQIGVVIADPITDSLVSSGHNGPPNLPCDNPEYLKKVVWPNLTKEEKTYALKNVPSKTNSDNDWCEAFVCEFERSGHCPRKIVGAESGKRLELCSCIHGETDAIVNARRSLVGCWIFCACGVPCIECTKLIIKAKLKTVVCLDNGDPKKDYSPYSSRWLLKKSATNLILVSKDFVPTI